MSSGRKPTDEWNFAAESEYGKKWKEHYDELYNKAERLTKALTNNGAINPLQIARKAPALHILQQDLLQLTDYLFGAMSCEEHYAKLRTEKALNFHRGEVASAYRMLLTKCAIMEGAWAFNATQAASISENATAAINAAQGTVQSIKAMALSRLSSVNNAK